MFRLLFQTVSQVFHLGTDEPEFQQGFVKDIHQNVEDRARQRLGQFMFIDPAVREIRKASLIGGEA